MVVLEEIRPLSTGELGKVVIAVTGCFCCAFGLCDHWGSSTVTSKVTPTDNFWGTTPSVWDHPEPNYMVSSGITEFWSVLTTIPIAGAMLTYQGLKYHVGAKVMRVYYLTCLMYTLACVAHLTLQTFVFSVTVTSVMSNAFMTFAQFSPVLEKRFESVRLRGVIVVAAELALISTVATLPYAIPHGGVWTLFAVQAPGVFVATGLASLMLTKSRSSQEKTTFGILRTSGVLLSAAMVLSLVECMVGFEYGFWNWCWGFPWLHISIHVLEQIGIYLYGIGIAALHEVILEKPPRVGAEVKWIGNIVPFLHCPHKRGDEIQFLSPENTKNCSKVPEQLRGRQTDQTSGKRRRDMTPGVVAPK